MKGLLIKLRDNIIKTKRLEFGMCLHINTMWEDGKFTAVEHLKLKKYFINDNIRPHFNKRWPKNRGFWFKPGLKKCRIKWLNEQIIRLELS